MGVVRGERSLSGYCPGWELSGLEIVRSENYPGWELYVVDESCAGGNCPMWELSSGKCQGVSVVQWELSDYRGEHRVNITRYSFTKKYTSKSVLAILVN